MAVDYLDLIAGLAVIVASVILVFSLYRAIEFGRVRVAGTGTCCIGELSGGQPL